MAFLSCATAVFGTSVLFTIGYVSGSVHHRRSGYVEFAITDKRMIADAIPYFEIFFHFVQKPAEMHFPEKVTYNSELMEANFLHYRCPGFTCRVIVNTHFQETSDTATACWRNSLRVLADHLAGIKDRQFDKLY